jgi:NAD(P)-dependent dehydrogenase (short-subunit alcohol dehydrogenase family)
MEEYNDKKPADLTLPFQIDLKDRVAVVTGGGGVLCSYFARALALSGAKVVILDLNLEAAQNVVDIIKAEGGLAQAIKTNILERKSIEEARSIILKSYGKCDILINGAGGNHPKGTTQKEFFNLEDLEPAKDITTFVDLDPESIKFIFNLNFLGSFLPIQVFLPDLAHATPSTIINISSMNAFTPLTKIPAYSAAKAAISNFTQWLAVHLSKIPIRVNAIAPGFFLTQQNKTLLTTENGDYTPRAQKILEHTPLGRFGVPEDLLGVLLWLVDEKATQFVTGTVIPIDGGFSAYSGV